MMDPTAATAATAILMAGGGNSDQPLSLPAYRRRSCMKKGSIGSDGGCDDESSRQHQTTTTTTASTKRKSTVDASSSTKPASVQVFDRVAPYLPDLYGVIPSYRWNRVTSRLSKISTLLTVIVVFIYIYISLLNFITTKPELIERSTFVVSSIPDVEMFPIPLIAYSVAYVLYNTTSNEETTVYLDEFNNDTYFTYDISHNTIIDQRRGGKHTTTIPQEHFCNCAVYFDMESSNDFCIHPEYAHLYQIQGQWIFEKYSYLNFKLNRCVDTTPSGEPCSLPEDVLALVQSSDSIEIQLSTRTDDYDVAADEISHTDRSWRWFAKAGVSLQHEIYMEYTKVDVNGRFIDSTFLDVDSRKVLSYGHTDSYDRPMGTDLLAQDEYLEFFIRLDTTALSAEVVYPSGSLITLITLWGAFLNIVMNFSIGLLTRIVNLFIFEKNFKKSTQNMTETCVVTKLRHAAADDDSDSDSDSDSDDNDDEDTNSSSRREGFGKKRRRSKLRRLPSKIPSIRNIELKSKLRNIQRTHALIKQHGDKILDYPLHKLDVRLLDADSIDHSGRFILRREELLHPTTVFGELRLIALTEHRKKHRAALQLAWFYYHYVKGRRVRQLLQAVQQQVAMKKQQKPNSSKSLEETSSFCSSNNTSTNTCAHNDDYNNNGELMA